MKASETQKARGLLKRAVRSFFTDRDYDEVETPIAVPCPGTEVYLRYFGTDWHDESARTHRLWLRSSPELHMKQLLSEGMGRIFQIAPCFRNGGEYADWHSPEFTMLEWYREAARPDDFIQETCDFLQYTRNHLAESLPVALTREIRPEIWTVSDLIADTTGIELIDEDDGLAAKCVAAGVPSVEPEDDFATAFFKILLNKVEPRLASIPFAVLQDYPASQAALARVENGVAKRFEFFVRGIELSNGFYELLDARENRKRVTEANRLRQSLGYEVTNEDNAFYAALEKGIPESCGNALGLDRWLACLLGHDHIHQVIPFRDQVWPRGDR